MAGAGARRKGTWLSGAVAIVTMLAFGAPQAFAATDVDLDPSPFGSSVEIEDLTNDDDAIVVSVAGGTITIIDTGTGGVTTADLECTPVSATKVTCPLDPADPAPPAAPNTPVIEVDVEMNNGTDSFTNENFLPEIEINDGGTTGNKTVNSGPSNDSVETGDGDDIVNTGAGRDGAQTGFGNDRIDTGTGGDGAFAGLGADLVEMGSGQDQILEDPFPNGPDVLNGGPGLEDRIGYNFGFGFDPVTIALNGQPDDGHSGEGDNVLGVEELEGSGGADTLIGDASANRIFGGPGDDTIAGGGGDDEIIPDDGNDSVDGGEGSDYVYGGTATEEGADRLGGGGGTGDLLEYEGDAPVTMTLNGQPDDGRAGEGDNISGFEGLRGGEGADTIVGDAANNLLDGNGGNDTLTGGPGTDEFFADSGDDVLLAVGGRDEVFCGLGFDTPIHDAADIVSGDCERRGAEVTSDSATAGKKGAKVKVACPAEEAATCKGKLVLVSNGKQLGSGKFKVAAGKTGSATVKLSKKGKKALAKSGNTLLLNAEAKTTEPQGTSTNADQLELEGKAKKKKKRGGKGGGKGR